MDDIQFGSINEQEALIDMKELMVTTKKGHFEMHKIYSNSQELMKIIPDKDKLESETDISVLGVKWHAIKDKIYCIFDKKIELPVTKRSFLAFLAKHYDPLSLYLPLTMTARNIMQRIWLKDRDRTNHKSTWDDRLDKEISEECLAWMTKIQGVEKSLSIPRYIHYDEKALNQIISFSDDGSAFGACVYLRSKTDEKVSVTLIYAKGRVAPIQKDGKTITIPRLELNGALLSVEIVNEVVKALNFSKEIPIYRFTDSQIVLSIIQNKKQEKVYVKNRLEKIRKLSDTNEWFFVRSEHNSAHCICNETDIIRMKELWLKGPGFLRELDFDPNLFTITKDVVANSNNPNIE